MINDKKNVGERLAHPVIMITKKSAQISYNLCGIKNKD
jgi:hypothetical protein